MLNYSNTDYMDRQIFFCLDMYIVCLMPRRYKWYTNIHTQTHTFRMQFYDWPWSVALLLREGAHFL